MFSDWGFGQIQLGFSVQEREEPGPGRFGPHCQHVPRAQCTGSGQGSTFQPLAWPCYSSSLFEVYHLPHLLPCAAKKTVQRKKKNNPPNPLVSPPPNEMSLFAREGRQQGASGTSTGVVAGLVGALVHLMSWHWGFPPLPMPHSHCSSLPACTYPPPQGCKRNTWDTAQQHQQPHGREHSAPSPTHTTPGSPAGRCPQLNFMPMATARR